MNDSRQGGRKERKGEDERSKRVSKHREKRERDCVCGREREIGERGERDTIECACATFPEKVVCNQPKFTTWSSMASIRIPPPYQSDALSYKTAGG
jgi:hypothetical protein